MIQRNKVTILVFHDISKATAERTFSYLSSRYNIIRLDQFLEACERKDQNLIPEKALIVTFDDGHIRNYSLLPLLERFAMPCTIFLCAGIINTKRHFWFKHRHETVSVEELKKKSTEHKLKLLAESGFHPERDYEFPQALTKLQIRKMAGMVNMEAHTMFHPCLPNCTDLQARTEIFGSKETLEHQFGLRIKALAYPNGDYTEREIALTKEAGYRCGVTVDAGFNTIASDLYKLRRIDTNDTDDINELIVKTSGLWTFFKSGFRIKT
ncbi:MAG TPA: polysaccharide deacetylase family protein [Sphingobacteriaceae bacterium]